MGWATEYIDKLMQGKTVQFRPIGRSMESRISSGQLCTIEPIGKHILAEGDIVLCSVGHKQYLHLIIDIRDRGYLIGNNKHHYNGWIYKDEIYGICTKIED